MGKRLQRGVLRRGNVISAAISIIIFIFFSLFFVHVVLCEEMTNREGVMNDKDIVIIKKQDDGKEIEIKHGDALQIELEEMGSTGYKWHVNTIDVEHVELITEKTVALREGVIGGPILHVWRFKVLKKGHADIKIDYYREWEGIEKAKDHFFIKLTIQ